MQTCFHPPDEVLSSWMPQLNRLKKKSAFGAILIKRILDNNLIDDSRAIN